MRKKLKLFDNDIDIRDVDWQAEARKWNYLVGSDQEGYRFAIHNIVEEIWPTYKNEWDAWTALYEELISLEEEVELLPSYEELAKWK